MKYPWLLIFLWILLIFLVNPLGDFPLNDDWQYAYPVKQWLENGQLDMQGKFAPNILLQVVWGYISCLPFGAFSFSYLRIGVLVLGGSTLLIFYYWLRQWNVSEKASFILSISLMLSPLFFNLSFSFMTDVPFLCSCLLSIRLFFDYVVKKKTVVLWGACILAVGAYLIRQPGLLLLPGFAVYILLEKRKCYRHLGKSGLLVVLALVVYIGLEKGVKPALGITEYYLPVSSIYFSELMLNPLGVLSTWSARFLKTFIYLGIFALPLLPFLWKSLQASRLLKAKSLFSILLLNLFLLLILWKMQKTFPFGGNIWFNWGLGPELLKDVYTLELENTPQIKNAILYVFQFLGQISACLIALLFFTRWSTLLASQKSLWCWLMLMNVLYLAVISIFSYFDRYILLSIASLFFLLAPWVSPPLLRKEKAEGGRWKVYRLFKLEYFPLPISHSPLPTSRFRLPISYFPLFLFGFFSLFATKDYLNWNRARKAAFEWLQGENVSIQQMDAGYEYNGWYNYHENPIQGKNRSFWWVTDEEYLITFGPVEGFTVVNRFPYYRWLWLRWDTIWVLNK